MNIGELAKFRGGVSADTISELTAASGVTIDSVLCKDGSVTGAASGTFTTTYVKAADTQGLALVNSSGTSVVTVSDAGAVTAAGKISTDSTTDATNATDGSLQTDGGLSVAKKGFFGSTTDVTEGSVAGSIVTSGGIDCAKTILSRAGGVYCFESTGVTSVGKEASAGFTLTSGASQGFTMSGFCGIVLVQAGGGQAAMFFISYLTTTVVAVSNPDSYFQVTDTGTTVAVYKNAGNSSAFTIKNKSAGDVSLRVTFIGTTV